ncbi:MAG TPA: chorismate mutase [Stellaceae bacterium]|nr:chorismate mutase [Stellaceae bacterium]
MSGPHWSLEDLRRQIDEIDDSLHDLLMRRAEVVTTVGAVKKDDGTPAMRPGREAVILRRLLARHRGPFPPAMMMRIWREILSGTVAMQIDFVVAVYSPDSMPGFWDLARDHYGSHTPMTAFRTLGQVLHAVTEGSASIGVLPRPVEGEAEPWWPHLISTDAHTPRVIARLPFAGRGNARDVSGDALAIGRGETEPTGLDRSLLAVETAAEMSRGRLLSAFKAGGLEAGFVAAIENRPGTASYLLEFDDVIGITDPRIASSLAPLGSAVAGVFSLGAYARPLTSAELARLQTGARRRS